jgi:hypothetical protein
MSMGFLLDTDQPVIWRGPMIMKTIQQFVMQVDWGALDCLLVDLPPGTGDAQLSLCQTVPLDGGVIVTTPQEASVGCGPQRHRHVPEGQCAHPRHRREHELFHHTRRDSASKSSATAAAPMRPSARTCRSWARSRSIRKFGWVAMHGQAGRGQPSGATGGESFYRHRRRSAPRWS